MMSVYFSINPVDSLHIRGNRLFADGFGSLVMPPWPSLFAGAVRSKMMVDRGIDFDDFAKGKVTDEDIARVIGKSPSEPGTFRIWQTALTGAGSVFFSLPSDLVPFETAGEGAGRDGVHLCRLVPVSRECLGLKIEGSFDLPMQPALRVAERSKPKAGRLLSINAMKSYLCGEDLPVDSTIGIEKLWSTDTVVGVGLNTSSRSVQEGLLYTTEAVQMKPGAGFFAAIKGIERLEPAEGLLRLGGDGKGAVLKPLQADDLFSGARPPWEYQPGGKRFRMILASPGIFPGGWLPPGCRKTGDKYIFEYAGFKAELKAAVVPRAETISGWDLANKCPKSARLVVPGGAVYWFETVEGDSAVLQDLAENGLTKIILSQESVDDRTEWQRRHAEGFNNVWFGEWID